MEANKNHEEIISRLLGRARFIRDTGSIKSSELLEEAAEIIKNLACLEQQASEGAKDE